MGVISIQHVKEKGVERTLVACFDGVRKVSAIDLCTKRGEQPLKPLLQGQRQLRSGLPC